MTEERFRDIEVRMRKVEDFILSQLNTLLELSQSLKGRVEVLEAHDVEFMAMVHSTCDIKNKEIANAREESIEISTKYTDTQHRQTWTVVAFIVTTIIGLVVYFNMENTARALDIRKHETQIDAMTKTLDKIDGKLDKLGEHIGKHNETR
jgi:hypothetical protein